MNILDRLQSFGIVEYAVKPGAELLRSAVLAALVAAGRVSFTGDPTTLLAWKTWAVAVFVGAGHVFLVTLAGKKTP